jgi:hypothetical protein
VSSNEDIQKALDDATAKIIEAIPTKDQTEWDLRIMFEADSRPAADFGAIFAGKG